MFTDSDCYFICFWVPSFSGNAFFAKLRRRRELSAVWCAAGIKPLRYVLFLFFCWKSGNGLICGVCLSMKLTCFCDWREICTLIVGCLSGFLFTFLNRFLLKAEATILLPLIQILFLRNPNKDIKNINWCYELIMK